MPRLCKSLILSCLAVAALLGRAAPAVAADDAGLKPVTIWIGLSLPPYIIPDEKRGMEYDIVKESLANAGYLMVPEFVPQARLTANIAVSKAAGGMPLNANTGLPLCFADSDIAYQNVAITLKSRHIAINSVADLKGKSIRSFQNAQIYLSQAYRDAVAGNADYAEAPNQETQDLMLYAGRVDVVVADRNIFSWYRKNVAKDVDVTQPIEIHAIFPPTPYGVGFRDPALCHAYNEGLRKLRSSGRYAAIVAAYGGE